MFVLCNDHIFTVTSCTSYTRSVTIHTLHTLGYCGHTVALLSTVVPPTPDSQSGHCCSLGANKGEVMLILNYLKFENGPPDPISPLFLCLPSQAIALANSEVTKATNDSNKKTWPIQEVSLKHRLNTSKLFWTPPCFTISTWSQLKVPSHYYSTLAFFILYVHLYKKIFNINN